LSQFFEILQKKMFLVLYLISNKKQRTKKKIDPKINQYMKKKITIIFTYMKCKLKQQQKNKN